MEENIGSEQKEGFVIEKIMPKCGDIPGFLFKTPQETYSVIIARDSRKKSIALAEIAIYNAKLQEK